MDILLYCSYCTATMTKPSKLCASYAHKNLPQVQWPAENMQAFFLNYCDKAGPPGSDIYSRRVSCSIVCPAVWHLAAWASMTCEQVTVITTFSEAVQYTEHFVPCTSTAWRKRKWQSKVFEGSTASPCHSKMPNSDFAVLSHHSAGHWYGRNDLFGPTAAYPLVTTHWIWHKHVSVWPGTSSSQCLACRCSPPSDPVSTQLICWARNKLERSCGNKEQHG